MPSPTQADPDYFIWEVAAEPVTVLIRHDVIERMAMEVAVAFRSVPKRGAEIGGLLIGTIEEGSPAVVRVEGYESVPCQYRMGPSYHLTEEDRAAFVTALESAAPAISPSSYAVGYFRSHTREGMSLDAGDQEILDHWFAGPSNVALLIKPHATQASRAGFFCRHDGTFPGATLLEFAFGVPDLLGKAAPPPMEIDERDVPEPGMYAAEVPETEATLLAPPDPVPFPVSPQAAVGSSVERRQVPAAVFSPPVRSGWLWIPLSFLALLMGVVIGVQVAPVVNPPVTASDGEEYALALAVTESGNNLDVHWNRQSPAIRSAQKAILEIEEGGYAKSLDLDPAQLRNGSVIYRYTLDSVRFRLTVYPSARVSLTESLTWKR